MNDERWENLTKMITDKFEVEEDDIKEIPQESGGGRINVLVCNTSQGKIKLERYVRPVVLNKKTFYSKRGGSETTVEYVYSKDETTQRLKLYKWNGIDDKWQELKEDNIGMLLG